MEWRPMQDPGLTLSRRTLTLAAVWLGLTVCTLGAQSAKPRASSGTPNVLTPAEAKDGWQLLFDGRTLTGWHGLGFSTTPPGLWTVEDGAIQNVAHRKGPGPGARP